MTSAPDTVYPTPLAEALRNPPERRCDCAADEDGPFVPYEAEEGPYVFCFQCHGYLVGPVGRRLCECGAPEALPDHLMEKARVAGGMRDALAESYRRRWFRLLIPLLGDANEAEVRVAWVALWSVARERATRRLAERGLV